MKPRMIALIGLAALTMAVCGTAIAGVEPAPWKPAINKLKAVANELESINRRLQNLLTTPPAKVSSAPEGILGKLEAITHQLREIDRHVGNLLSPLPLDPAALPSEAGRVFRNVQEGLQTIANLAGNGFSTRPTDPRIAAALAGVERAAWTISNRVVAYVYTGYQEWQTLNYVKIFVQPTCNDDCSMCGQVSLDRVKSIMEGTNAIMYRSGSSVRARPRLSFVPPGMCETIPNSNCTLFPGVKVITTTIDGDAVEVLGYRVSYGDNISYQIIDFGDWNSDGKIDGNDKDALCRPWNEEESDQVTRTGQFVQIEDHAALVFVRNGTKEVAWDSDHNVWRHSRHSGGASSGQGFGIVMPNNMGDAGGNSFTHELGHYLCNFHTFEPHPPYYNKNLTTPVYDQIAEKIVAARDALCPSSPSSCDPQAVVNRAFDHDDEINYELHGNEWWDVYNASSLELNNMPITDTPADPGADVWAEIYGQANLCSYDLISMPFVINGILYDVRPDRTNIMSYFKGCFPREDHFSPIQKERSERAVTELHRKPVTESLAAKTWRNKTHITIGDATYIYQPSNPVDLNNIPLKWATSKISVADGKGAVSRVVVGVNINQIVGGGGLHIQLIDPNGITHTLQQPSENEFRILETIRNLFYIDMTVKNGLWTLRVAEQPNYGMIDTEGFISDWQLQFETP